MAKKKFYAVLNGHKTGIFQSWDDCKKQVNGFKNAKYKAFKTMEEAKEYFGVSKISVDVAREELKPATTSPPTQETQEKRAIDVLPQDPPSAPKRPRVEGDIKSEDVSRSWHVMIGFDGGSRGNPGVAGAGAEVIVLERTIDGIQRARTKIHIRRYLDTRSTNNMAEWQGVVSGMNQVVEEVQKFSNENAGLKPEVKLVVQGDSQLVIRQVEGRYKVNNACLKRYKIEFDSTLSRLRGMVSTLNASYQHVYRCDNAVADRLANEAMDAKSSWVTREEDKEENETNDKYRPLKRSKVYNDF